ncbi:MAG: lipocalin family protein [Flavitalea sp.]
MRIRSISLFVIPVLLIMFASCTAEKKLKRRITGQWRIESYEEQNTNGESGKIDNPGTIEFFRNGKGKKMISGIPWRSTIKEGNDFRWQNSANTITLFDQNSIFAKSWIITVNKKSRQQWRSTDRGNVQTIELRR